MSDTSQNRSVRRPVLFPVVLCGLALWLVACSSSTDPPGGDNAVLTAEPAAETLDLVTGNTQTFRIGIEPDGQVDVIWSLDGTSVGTGAQFVYDAVRVGCDTLAVDANAGGTILQRDWVIDVAANQTELPPPVQGIVINHGELGGQVLVRWERIPASVPTYPIDHYLVAISDQGVITNENWEDATVVGNVEETGQTVGYEILLDDSEPAIVQGEFVWVAVRGVDTAGQMSPLVVPNGIMVSVEWWIEGYVYDDLGNTLPNIIVSWGCPDCKVNTDVNGFYRLGPFNNHAQVVLETISSDENPGVEPPYTSWYDYRTDPLEYEEGGQYDIVLMTRYPVDAECPQYANDFLGFFRHVTGTLNPMPHRDDVRLYTWEHYPVSVHVPDYTGGSGWDMDGIARWAVDLWNTSMGEEYLVLTDDYAAADIYFEFPEELIGYNGLVTIMVPAIAGLVFGEDIPERMRVQVTADQPSVQRIKEVTLHELGHTLAYCSFHSPCNNSSHLMRISSAGALDNGEDEAIHMDERRVVRCVRVLPQGANMANFDPQ